MLESRTRAGDRRLFEFLAATKPEHQPKGTAAAVAASVGGHGLVIGLAIWATVVAARRDWTPPEFMAHEDLVVLLSPGQLSKLTSNTVARAPHIVPVATTRTSKDAPLGLKDLEAAPSADPVRTAVKIMPIVPDPAEDIDAITRQADAVLVSLHESEYGGLGEDSATTRVAAIVDEHHEPTAERLAEEGPHLGGSFTEAPVLTNAEQVKRLLSRDYPAFLRDGGVGGRVLLWFLIDEEGKVRRCLLKASSGHAALDRVAMKEAVAMRFRPAWNYDRHVPLWIVLPITFVVDEG